MSESSAEPLSPMDAASLWPQMRRLDTEVIATRHGENLLVSSGLAATRLTNLPRVRRTVVLGVRRGFGYRGVLVARELGGGIAWEVVSVRLARDTDEEAIDALLVAVSEELRRRSGHALYLRYAEGSSHAVTIKRSGFHPYVSETLFAPPPAAGAPNLASLRDARKADAYDVFRLYCQTAPERVRRHEAPTFDAWAAVHDSFDVSGELVCDAEPGLRAWIGLGEREGRLFHREDDAEGVLEAALAAVETSVGRTGTLVSFDYQESVARRAIQRGYTELGTRVVCVRNLAIAQALEERVAASEPSPIPQ